ncbi:MAG: PaaD-like zinc ribbon domain-containing protein [Candidatus Thorarchaeota archaeon]
MACPRCKSKNTRVDVQGAPRLVSRPIYTCKKCGHKWE